MYFYSYHTILSRVICIDSFRMYKNFQILTLDLNFLVRNLKISATAANETEPSAIPSHSPQKKKD